MSHIQNHNVLLTGVPGIGKTTLVKNICDKLTERGCRLSGFYTEEVRDMDQRRVGFDVISFDGQRERLARISEQLKPNDERKFRVAQYYVFVSAFEKMALQLLDSSNIERGGVLVIDEIGNMELLSKAFAERIVELFNKSTIPILATIPIRRRKSLISFDNILSHSNNHLMMVGISNRNRLAEDIIATLNITC